MRQNHPNHAKKFGRVTAAIIVGLLLAVVVGFGWVQAHAQLARSEPAVNAVLGRGPADVRIWFTEQPEAKFSQIAVTNVQSERVDLGDTRPIPGETAALLVSLADLPAGVYTVGWRTLSTVDGHESRGFFAFAVGQEYADKLPKFEALPSNAAGDYEFSYPAAAARWVGFVAGAMLIGALWLQSLVFLPALAARSQGAADGGWDHASRATTTYLLNQAGWGLVALVIASFALLLLQAWTGAFGELGALLPTLETMITGTRFGVLMQLRLLLLVVVGVALWTAVSGGARRRPATAAAGGRGLGIVASADANAAPSSLNLFWPFVLTISAWALLTVSLNSHAAAAGDIARLATLADWLHLMAASIWLGGLIGLAFALPRAWRPLNDADRLTLTRDVVGRFSWLAAGCVVILMITGGFAAWLHVGGPTALIESDYGRALLVKLGFVIATVALGAFHLLWLRPRLAVAKRGRGRVDAARVTARLRRFGHTLRAEWLAGGLVLVATAALVNLSPPAAGAGPIDAAPSPGVLTTLSAADLKVRFRVVPAVVGGLNSFEVFFEDRARRAVTGFERVSLRLTPLDADLGETELRLEPNHGDDSSWVELANAVLAVEGRWNVRVLASRPGQPDVDTTFLLSVAKADQYTLSLVTQPGQPRLGRARFDLYIADKDGQPAFDIDVESQVLMPAHAHEANTDWRPLGNGHYRTDVDLTMDGRWLNLVQVTPRGSVPVEAQLRFDVPE